MKYDKDFRKKQYKPLIFGSIVIALFVLVSFVSGGFGNALRSFFPVGWFGKNVTAGIEEGWGGAVVLGRGLDNKGIYKETIFLPSGENTYIYGEALFPEGAWAGAETKNEIDLTAEGVPLVLIAHGFSGTLNSGGAAELAREMASQGIATIRVDFDPRVRPELKAEKTGFYDLESMKRDMKLAADYMCHSYAIDEDKICLYARSMGGRVAMTMGNESYGGYDYKAMALVAPAGNEEAMIYYMGGEEKWDKMKEEARNGKLKSENGTAYTEKQGVKLTYDWFCEFEAYNPCEHGEKFGNKPVMVIYNTLDTVVLPETSKECAKSYKNSRIVEVTTEDGHGYEMGFKESELKLELMREITDFILEALDMERQLDIEG